MGLPLELEERTAHGAESVVTSTPRVGEGGPGEHRVLGAGRAHAVADGGPPELGGTHRREVGRSASTWRRSTTVPARYTAPKTAAKTKVRATGASSSARTVPKTSRNANMTWRPTRTPARMRGKVSEVSTRFNLQADRWRRHQPVG